MQSLRFATAMDLKLIEQKQLVERYLFGRLSPPEAKFFEQVLRRSPELAERMGLPEALRRNMQLLDETGLEWREKPPRFWHDVRVPLALGGALLLAAVLAIATWSANRELAAENERLQQSVLEGAFAAPGQTRTIRVVAAREGEAVPTVVLGSREAPTLAELRIGAGAFRGNLYRALIVRTDGTHWGRIDSLTRDTNGELRLAFNSAAFAAGAYDVRIESVNLRGEGRPAGRFFFRVDAR